MHAAVQTTAPKESASKRPANEPASQAVLDPPVAEPVLVRKTCPCGGGCPRCRGGGHIQTKLKVSMPGDPAELEADGAAEAVVNGRGPHSDAGGTLSRAAAILSIQRKCSACEKEEEEKEVQRKAEPGAEPAHTESAGGRIVEDDADRLGPGQMRKTEFMAHLRAAICKAIDAVLAGTNRSTQDCPWLEKYFSLYAHKSAAEVEGAVRRYLQNSESGKSAADYIAHVVVRVSHAAAVWKKTGQLTDLPEGGIAGAPPAPQGSHPPDRIARKSQDGAAAPAADVQSVRSQLGDGSPLDGGVRSRMERAFGADFSAVRVHTDATGGRLSDELGARAFTLGSNIAFGPGEYRPGTPWGDLLLAHELAHVVQQGHAEPDANPILEPEPAEDSLETDADHAALGATLSLWDRARAGIGDLAGRILPQLKSGLRIQRCRGTRKKCPSNRHWAVVGPPFGGGSLGCLCRWECVLGAPRVEMAPSSESHYECPAGEYCGEGPPPIEEVGEDYQKVGDGKFTGGASMMQGDPVTGDVACGCIPPEDLVGAETPPPIPTGVDVTSFHTGPLHGGVGTESAPHPHEGTVEHYQPEVKDPVVREPVKEQVKEPVKEVKEPPKEPAKGTTTGAPDTPAKPGEAFDPLEGTTKDTRDELNRPEQKELKEALTENPKAAKALRRCQSLCYPKFAKKSQIKEIENILEKAERNGLVVNYERLQERLRDPAIRNADDLDVRIRDLKAAYDYQIELGADIATKVQIDTRPQYKDESPLADTLRRQPGTASGGESLKVLGKNWIQEGKAALFPKQIADQMRDKSFKNFDEFRAEFWRLVEADPELRSYWDRDGYRQNLTLMKRGLAPYVVTTEQGKGGGRAAMVYNLDHKLAIKNTGGVYDMDNIQIVSPSFHENVGEK